MRMAVIKLLKNNILMNLIRSKSKKEKVLKSLGITALLAPPA